jgi:hypothetical protein
MESILDILKSEYYDANVTLTFHILTKGVVV